MISSERWPSENFLKTTIIIMYFSQSRRYRERNYYHRLEGCFCFHQEKHPYLVKRIIFIHSSVFRAAAVFFFRVLKLYLYSPHFVVLSSKSFILLTVRLRGRKVPSVSETLYVSEIYMGAGRKWITCHHCYTYTLKKYHYDKRRRCHIARLHLRFQ